MSSFLNNSGLRRKCLPHAGSSSGKLGKPLAAGICCFRDIQRTKFNSIAKRWVISGAGIEQTGSTQGLRLGQRASELRWCV
jgi:hypothetical protein